jgi:hypothetical protein
MRMSSVMDVYRRGVKLAQNYAGSRNLANRAWREKCPLQPDARAADRPASAGEDDAWIMVNLSVLTPRARRLNY